MVTECQLKDLNITMLKTTHWTRKKQGEKEEEEGGEEEEEDEGEEDILRDQKR